MRLKLTTLALTLAAPAMAFAQDPAAAPAASAEAQVAMPAATGAAAPAAPAVAAAPSAGPTLKWDGLVDSYYMFNTNSDPSITPSALRAFDTNSNSFTLNYAKLGLQADTENFGAHVDFGYGHTGTVINNLGSLGVSGVGAPGVGMAPGVADPRASALYSGSFIVQQAFAQAKLGKLTIDAGKFVTTAGAEVIETNKNWLYSRSLLFAGIPYLHTGVRLNYKATDEVSAQLSVVNGINNDPDNNGQKTFGANVAYAKGPMALALTGYFGKEGPQGNEGDLAMLIDLVAGYAVSDKLALNLNFDYSKMGDANWLGVSVMAKYSLMESLYLAGRFEFLKNEKLYAAPAESLMEATVMAGIPLGGNFEARVELRMDMADKEIFMAGKDPKKNQMTALVGAVASF